MKKNNKLVTILLASSLLLPGIAPLASGVTSVAAATETVAVGYDKEYVVPVMDQVVRHMPRENASPVTPEALAKRGENLKFVSVHDDKWFKVQYGEEQGYVLRGDVTSRENFDSENTGIHDLAVTKQSGMEDEYTVAVRTSLRTSNAERYRPLKVLGRDTKVKYLGTTDSNKNWFKVELADKTVGYVNRADVTRKENMDSDEPAEDYATKSELDENQKLDVVIHSAIRTQPGSQYRVLSELDRGTVVTYKGTTLKDNNWFKVELENGTLGYINRGHVTKAEEPVEEDLTVESVSAINGKQVKVTFNGKVDDVEAEKNATYIFTELDGQDTTSVTSAKLQEDEKSVIVTVDKELEKRYQFKLLADKIESATDSTVKVNYNETVTFAKDITAPTITGTERVSATKVKVKFSEPIVYAAGNISAKYADTTLTLDDTKVKADGTALNTAAITTAASEVVLDLSASEVDEDKDIIVTFNGIKDAVGNLISPQPSKVTVVKKAADTVAPKIASVTQTGARTFNIKFDKATTLTAWTADGTEVGVTGGAKVTGFDRVAGTDNEYKVTVDTANLDGLQTVTVAANKVTNIDGEDNDSALTKLVTFVEDKAAPVATAKLVVNDDAKEVIQLTFDKDVVLGSGEVAVSGSYVKDYVTTTLAGITDATAVYADGTGNNKKVVNVALEKDSSDPKKNLAVEGAVYDITLASTNIKSEAGKAMADKDVTFTRGKDGVAANTAVIKAADIALAAGSNPDEVKVTFSNLAGKELDGATASNVANYSIDGAVVKSATVAPESGNSQVVTLKLEKNSNTFTGIRNATVKNIKIAGSTKVMVPVTKLTADALPENVRPTIESAKITANNQITITFSEAMGAVDMKEAFLVKAGTEKLNTYTTTATSSGNTVVLTLEAPGFTTEQLAKTITVEAAKKADGSVDTDKLDVVKDANGNKLEAFDAMTVVKP